MTDNDKLWSLSAEAAVIGSILVDRDLGCFNRILPILPTEDAFYKEEHRILYAALLELFVDKQPTNDAVVLRTLLENKGQLDKVGGTDYLAEIMETTPSAVNGVYYAGVVRDRQRYRDLITDIEKMQGMLIEPLTVDEKIQGIRDIAFALQKGRPEEGVFEVSEEAADVAATMHEYREVISTGFKNIDFLISGVQPGELCILAGRPSMGKSALALCMALSMAKEGRKVIFFTLEMKYRALIKRMIVNLAGVTVADYENPKTAEAARTLEGLDIVVVEGCNTPESQAAFIRARRRTHGVDVCFVDYLQRMSAGTKVESRQQEMTTISLKLKTIALQEGVPVVALSQLNRQVESRTSHRPRMSDLRESGAIEQDADIVLLLHREDYYRRNEDPNTTDTDGRAEVIVAKSRDGPTGIAKLVFLGEFVRFGDMSYG